MIVRFHGHACFELEASDGTRLCIDPYESGGFDGAVALPALPDHFAGWVATHGHPDHAAGHTIPSAERVRPPCRWGPFELETRRVWHDEFAGKLRGGSVEMLRAIADGSVVLHVGDLGERIAGPDLEWIRSTRIDLLIVPVGGYYTLGPDGAAELAALVTPGRVIPCHSSDDGVLLPALGAKAPFVDRFGEATRGASVDLSVPPERPIEVTVIARA